MARKADDLPLPVMPTIRPCPNCDHGIVIS